MIRIITTLLFLLFTLFNSLLAQQISGTWYGKLKIPNQNIRINFTIVSSTDGFKTTMDSPDQGAFKIPTDKTNFKNNKLEIFLNSMMISYKGELKNNQIIGTFHQGGSSFPLVLSKEKIQADKQKTRFQDPKKPYSYITEDVFFTNSKANNIKLAGTLSLLKNVKNPPVVILISGSGPQNRDEEIKVFNHRPFLVLSDFLTKRGIAVLRYDDRGVGQSKGIFKGATTKDFASDTKAAVNYLKNRKDLNFSKLGLIGHSEGGLIAPMVASENKNIDFIILLAGPGVDGGKILESQSRKISQLAGVSLDILDFNESLSIKIHQVVKNCKTAEEVKPNLASFFKKFITQMEDRYKPFLPKKTVEQIINTYSDNWMWFFVKTNPKEYLQQVPCPILALNGAKDVQVLSDINLPAIKEATKNNTKVTVKEMQNHNHLFQTCSTGNITEYAKIEETISPLTMEIITTWINQLN